MELSVSSPKPSSILSALDSMSDPEEEHEISEEEDDDRNHKHRRKEEMSSNSLEQGSSDQAFSRPYRKNYRNYENGNEHDKRSSSSTQRVQYDNNQRTRLNPYPGRGRGKGNYGNWSQRETRFNPNDLSSHMVGPMAPGIYGGNGPWPGFGMIPNGGMDGFHHLQGPLRPTLNAPVNMGIPGIPRQRCRDFEERGFCLRGDMCPMEHGINRIVVDDVQSLSQFNLPVSVPAAPHMAASSSKPVSAQLGYPSFMNSKGGAHGKNNEGGNDFYDPDQPLWNSSGGETSGTFAENVAASVDDSKQDGTENPRSASKPGWGRMRGSSSSQVYTSTGLEDQSKDGNVDASVTKVFDSSNDARKPSQKALKTLFVSGVPHESNRRDLILAHFQKFGKVIDIHIPVNSERAFVQFSKREEAESALRAPDAVMGNRFIKLWWANRDSVPDIGLSTGNGTPMKGRGVQNQLPSSSAPRSNLATKGPAFAPSSSEQPKPVAPKVTTPLQQKKADTLERLKETLRKKQEMLEQKRNEFRKRLATLQKQGTGVKGEETDEPDAKRVKVDPVSDSAVSIASPKGESSTDKKVSIQKPVSIAKLSTETPSPNLKQRPYPFTSSVRTPMTNRFKLDNRTTTIKVIPPLPTGLADVSVLKEHFSSFGEVSKVELEEISLTDSGKEDETCNENRAAFVTFVKRNAAEKAFANGKSWQEHVLKFVWVTRKNNKENSSNNNNNSNSNLSVTVEPKPVDEVKAEEAEKTEQGTTKGSDEVKAEEAEKTEQETIKGSDEVKAEEALKIEQETTEGSEKGNDKSESIEGATELVAVSGTDEEQING